MTRSVNHITVYTNFEKLLAVFRTQNNIAKACKRTKGTVSIWRSLGLVPVEHVPTLIKAAGGKLKASDIRPDIFNDCTLTPSI